MSEKKKGPNYEVPALEKGLDIIEVLADSPIPLSQIEIARRLEKTVSQVFRMITCLEKRGYIYKDPESSVYSLTLKMYQLVNHHPPVEKLLRTATGPVMDLVNKIEESCHLTVLKGSQVVILSQHDSPKRVSVHVRVGSTLTLLESNSGRALVAYKDRKEQEIMLSNDPKFKKMTKAEKEAVYAQLDEIKENGFFNTQSYSVSGIVDLVVPVIAGTTEAIAALTVPCIQYLGEEIPFEKIINEMTKTAALIAKQSGIDK
ncbi:MAG: IclR family transcriptional regulator [Lentisphaeraceae bacterium]|nr:IclR family transcriptional regulator [Lentisphaeraceae bacterium]